MLVCFWSPKGGSGTSVIAAAAALVLARETDARIVDLSGDQPAVLGLAHDPVPGLLDWRGSRLSLAGMIVLVKPPLLANAPSLRAEPYAKSPVPDPVLRVKPELEPTAL